MLSHLLAASAVQIRSPLADAELASENFYFLDPGLHVFARQDRALRLRRWPGGFDGVRGLISP